MATKTITVTEDAYSSIANLKQEGESFSQLFTRLGKNKGVAEKYFGILKGDITTVRKRFAQIRSQTDKDIKKRENVFTRHKRTS